MMGNEKPDMGMGMPEKPSTGSMSEVCVPLASVMQEDEGAQGIPPEVGDTVMVQLGGKVTRIDGENVYFTADSANGEPISGAGETEEQMMDRTFSGEEEYA